jgi:hypothetical protein
MSARKPTDLPTVMVQGSPGISEFTISAPTHVTINGQRPPEAKRKHRAAPTDVEVIRSLAKHRGWSDDQFYNMSTGRMMKALGDDWKKLEGNMYHERDRSTYRRAQRRLKG